MTANLQNPIFTDEAKAREWLEARVWPNGPVCPHCGATDEDVRRLEGSKHRPGLFQCSQCREQFTVTVKTVFERSKVPLSKWLAALFMMTASKKGVSAHQIHRSLAISYKTAWFVCHRLREAMRVGGLAPLGGSGKVVEADERYHGNVDHPVLRANKAGRVRANRKGNKRPIVALLERGGSVRTFHVPFATKAKIAKIASENIARETRLYTDESNLYPAVGRTFEAHKTVKHSIYEDVRWEDGERIHHTNTVVGYFSIFKRGMRGVYQHCSEKHLYRCLAEFDFRYSNRASLGVNDLMRAELAAAGIKGKRLTYRRPHRVAQSSAH
jgi:transposase-like protein